MRDVLQQILYERFMSAIVVLSLTAGLFFAFRIFRSVRWAAVIAAGCMIIGNMTVFAVEKIIQRFHVKGEIHIEEGKGIVLGNKELGMIPLREPQWN